MADEPTIAILHPGQMGTAVAKQLRGNDVNVLWLSEGRSVATRERAEAAGLRPVGSLAELVDSSSMIFSICPSDAVEDIARSVADHGFSGIYIDANSIAPERVKGIAKTVEANGATVVDGGLLGASIAEKRFYLAGPADAVTSVAQLFAGTSVRTIPLDGEVGNASALKVAFALWQKGARALAAVSYALADRYEVVDRLCAEAETEADAEAKRTGRSPLSDPAGYLLPAAVRGWRWELEMGEIADTLAMAGLPGDLPLGAAEVFARWVPFRDRSDGELAEALAMLRTAGSGESRPA
jgi:3-hydroxyisobutyrate dehydrogenase-like beta-hydroxyacid dehydrogenase